MKGGWLAFVSIVAVLAGLTFWAAERGQFDRLFEIKAVSIDAEWPVTAEQVRSWVGVLEGMSLIGLDGVKVVRGLESKPWVKEASVRKSYPGTLQIFVKARKPVALWSKARKLWTVDVTGKRIAPLTGDISVNQDWLVISSLSGRSEEQWSPEEAVRLGLRLQDAFRSIGPISELVLDELPFFRVYLKNRRLELQYSLDTWESQLETTEQLLARPPEMLAQVHRINLVYPKKAVVRAITTK